MNGKEVPNLHALLDKISDFINDVPDDAGQADWTKLNDKKNAARSAMDVINLMVQPDAVRQPCSAEKPK